MRSTTLLAFAFLAAPAFAQAIQFQQSLAPQLTTGFEHMGAAVAKSGGYALIGVPDADVAGVDSGAVELWNLSSTGWSRTALITAPDGAPGDHFGATVAISGGDFVIGAPGADAAGIDSGAVYSYRLQAGTPVLLEKLVAFDAAAGDAFGSAVSLTPANAESWWLAVGAPRATPHGADSGAAYAYHRAVFTTPWVLAKKHDMPGGAVGDRFGTTVVIDYTGNSAELVVGAPLDDDPAIDSGSVWFGSPNANALTKLVIPGAQAGDHLGLGLGYAAYAIYVGDPGYDQPAADAGIVWRFDVFGTLLGSIQPATIAAGDAFGSALSVDWDSPLLVGAPGEDGAGLDAGAAFLFTPSGTQLARIQSPAPVAGHRWGSALSINWYNAPKFALIGDALDSSSGQESGSTAVFLTPVGYSSYPIFCVGNPPPAVTLPPCPCSTTPLDRGCPNSAGPGGLLAADGIPSVLVDTIHLIASDLPPSTFGLLVQGSNVGNAVVVGDGRRCFTGTITRIATHAAVSGVIQFGFGTGSTPISVAGGIPPGGGFNGYYYQVYYRDNTSFCTPANFNFTNGVVITWGP